MADGATLTLSSGWSAANAALAVLLTRGREGSCATCRAWSQTEWAWGEHAWRVGAEDRRGG
eukprot:1700217-Prymnesium_polylepis.1